jgi:hypothetical protein
MPLPGDSPDLMPVEALWRWLREDVTYHHCHGERQKPGALRRELDCLLAGTEASVQHRGPDLEHAMGAPG